MCISSLEITLLEISNILIETTPDSSDLTFIATSDVTNGVANLIPTGVVIVKLADDLGIRLSLLHPTNKTDTNNIKNTFFIFI
jgi:hypothetical protein